MTNTSGKKLFLFTVGFPFGNYETSFLTQEIPILARYFDKVYLIPSQATTSKPLLTLPENVETLIFDFSSKLKQKRIKNYYDALIIVAREIFTSGNFKSIKNIRYHLSETVNFSVLANELNTFLQTKLDSKKDVCYSYWLDEWASILSIVKENYINDIKIVSRAHGFDLYDYRHSKGYIFPRHLQLKNVEKVIAVSANGASYLAKKYPSKKDKMHYSRLGVSCDNNKINSEKKKELITLVSCSGVIKLKRIHLIAKILMCSENQIKWVHFGDGPLLREVKEICKNLPDNVTVELSGNVTNSEIKKYYATNFVDWFINVSQFEGIPVSMMEAISYGIPIIATDVGGVNEIVNEATGILIPKDFEPSEVARMIEKESFDSTKRNDVQTFWEEHYNAEKNFTDFSHQLLNLS